MALFGNDMVDVTTPDGRRLTLPSQLAASFPDLQPVLPPETAPMGAPPSGPPPIPGAPPVPTFSAQDHADLAKLSAPPPEPMPAPKPQPAPAQAASVSPAPAPQPPAAGGPVTNADLAKMGNAGVYNAEISALDQRQAAIQHLAEVDAAEATKIGEHLAARDKVAHRLLAERAQIAADQSQRLDARMREYETNAKAIANTKIDRSVDHPILAALSVALAGIGSAIKGEAGNPALDMLFKQIDRKVAGQMQDLDRRRTDLGVQRDQLGMMRDTGRDRLAEFDQRRIAALDQAMRQVETIKAQSGSDRVRANADLAVAGIATERAKTLGSAADRERQRIVQEQDRKDKLLMHRQSLGVQYAGLNETKRHNIAEEGLQQQQREIEAMKAMRAGKADEAKLIRERAMGGEVTPVKDKDGKPVLNEKGEPEIQVGLITKKDGSVWVPNGTDTTVTALQKKHNAAVQFVQTLDEIRKLGPEWLSDTANSDKLQRMKQLMGDARLQAIAAQNLGVPTGRDIELAEAFIGTTDPSRWFDSVAGLMQSRDSIVRDHNVELRHAGLDKDWNPPDLGKRGAGEQPGDIELRSAMQDPRRADPAQWAAEVGGVPYLSAGAGGTLPANQRAAAYVQEHGAILPSQQATIEAWGTALRGDNPKARDKAAEYLRQVIDSGGSPAIKKLAQEQLAGAVTPFATGTPEATGAPNVRSVSPSTVQTKPTPKEKPPKQIRRDSAGNPLP